MKDRRTTAVALTATTALALGLGLVAAPAALANAGDVVRTGACSAGTDWKLKASPENGRIEVEAEVDSNRSGQAWVWRLRHDGAVSAHGMRVTHRPSGSFTVRRLLVNLAGDDTIGFRAVNRESGETCRATLTF